MGGGAGTCEDVSGDYGDCSTPLGWGFDGTECALFNGCGCAPHCDGFFDDPGGCASTCAADHCDTAAMKAAYLAESPFVVGNHCDGVYVCTADAASSGIEAMFPGIVCEQSGLCPPGEEQCAAYYSGMVTEAQWQTLCAASLLPQIDDIYCIVYGP